MHVFVLLEALQRRVARELAEVLDADVAAVGLRRLRVLQLVSAQGLRQGELAERAQVTKQAIAEHVDALAEQGLVGRTPDPDDGRAWRVVRTAEGERVSEALDRAIARAEAELARSVGARRYAGFTTVLRELGEL